MFYGDMADKSKVIRIPDIAPIGFENLLRYAYTGQCRLTFEKGSFCGFQNSRQINFCRFAQSQLGGRRHVDGVCSQKVSLAASAPVSCRARWV